MHMTTKVVKLGNSLALRLTGDLRTIPQFKEGEIVNVEVSKEGLSITKQRRLTEDELLDGLTPHSAHADGSLSLLDKEFDN